MRTVTVAAAVLAATLGLTAARQPQVAYVHGSRVVLRATADATSAAAGRLTTNTLVEVQRDDSGRCTVRVPATGASGVLACALLGDRPLTLDDTARALADPALTPGARFDWTARAFWIAPSLARLIQAGAALEAALLDQPTLEREDNTGRSARFPHPEFEAMKASLATALVRTVAPPPALDDAYYFDEISKRITLPATRSSFFGANEPLALVPLRPLGLSNAVDIAPWLADALSAAEATPYHAGRWRPDYATHIGRMGVWDVSGVDVRFDRPATVHGITSAGRPTAYAIRAMGMEIGAKPCTTTPVAIYGSATDAAWRSAIVAWAGRSAPGVALVDTRVVDGETPSERVTADTIDLDRDGHPDIVRWSGVREPVVDHASRWGAVFANVAGTWTLMAYVDEPDCT